MKIKLNPRFVAILFAAGVTLSLRACSNSIHEQTRNPQPVKQYETYFEADDREYNTKEGYILDSNLELDENEKCETQEDTIKER